MICLGDMAEFATEVKSYRRNGRIVKGHRRNRVKEIGAIAVRNAAIGAGINALWARGGLGNNAGLIKTTKIMGEERFRERRDTPTRRQGIKNSPRSPMGQSQELKGIKKLNQQKRAYQELSPTGIKREMAGTTKKGLRRIGDADLHQQIVSANNQRIRKAAVRGGIRSAAIGTGLYGIGEVVRWKRRQGEKRR